MPRRADEHPVLAHAVDHASGFLRGRRLAGGRAPSRRL
jgi:hypothetical protein